MFGSSNTERATRCLDCGSDVAEAVLACPACGQLLHSDTLKRLAGEAESASGSGRTEEAIAAWRKALALVPTETRQSASILRKIEALEQNGGSAVPGSPSSSTSPEPIGPSYFPGWKKGAAGLGGLGVLLWKLKFALIFLLTKAKLILLGFTKMGTLLSMLLSFAVYWQVWGWKFALGFVLSIYVHEMGHVLALQRHGIPASAPMFIPGVGAFVRMNARPASPREDADVGLAGPMFGLGAALVSAAIWWSGGGDLWAAIAHTGAIINLFNLLPVWQLDGARGIAPLNRTQRTGLALLMAGAAFASGVGLLYFLALVTGARAFEKKSPASGSSTVTIQFSLLVAALSVLCAITGAAGAPQ